MQLRDGIWISLPIGALFGKTRCWRQTSCPWMGTQTNQMHAILELKAIALCRDLKNVFSPRKEIDDICKTIPLYKFKHKLFLLCEDAYMPKERYQTHSSGVLVRDGAMGLVIFHKCIGITWNLHYKVTKLQDLSSHFLRLVKLCLSMSFSNLTTTLQIRGHHHDLSTDKGNMTQRG